MKSSELHITRDDFISTYTKGLEHVHLYNQVNVLKQKGLNSTEIYERLAEQYTYPQVKGKYQSINEGKKPQALHAAEQLEELKLLPMGIHRVKFPALNLLASQIFWRGVQSPFGRNQVTSRVNIMEPEQLELVEAILDGLGCTYNTKPSRLRDDGSASTIVDVDQRVGRLISLMGFQVGAKSHSDFIMPTYLEEALVELNVEDLADRDRVRLFEMVHDFASTLLHFRAKFKEGASRSRTEYTAHLISYQSEESAIEQTELTKELLEATHPDLFSSCHVYQHSETKTYYGKIRLKTDREKYKHVVRNYRKRVQSVVGDIHHLCA